MGLTRRVLGLIGWLRTHKVLVVILVVGLEILIGLIDFIVSDSVPITALHYLTIALATVIFGWPGAVILSLEATFSFYLSSYVGQGKSLENLAGPGVGLTLFIFLAISAGVVLILRLLASLQAANKTLSEKVALLQASRAQVELLSSERERLRLARELHDGVTKTLSGIEYTAAALTPPRPGQQRASSGQDSLYRASVPRRSPSVARGHSGLTPGLPDASFGTVANLPGTLANRL